MPTAVEGRLPGVAVVVDDQRVQVNPTVARRDQLDPVRAPIRFDGVSEVGQCRQDLILERGVDVAVRPGLVTDEGVDAPPALDLAAF